MEARWDVVMAARGVTSEALASYLIVSLLAVVGLVPRLVAGIWILLIRPLLAVSVGPGRFLLRRCSATEEAGLLKNEPEVSRPQDQVNEAKSLEEEDDGTGSTLPSPNSQGQTRIGLAAITRVPSLPSGASPQRC